MNLPIGKCYNFCKIFGFLLLQPFLAQCDADPSKDPGVGSLLLGTAWEGQLVVHGANGQVGKSIPLSLNFFADETFRATHLTDVGKDARGQFRDMPHHSSVMVEITHSNFPEFAKQGTFMSFDYSAHGSELMLRGQSSELRMLLSQSQDVISDNPLHGSWRCEENTESTWTIDVSGLNFWGRKSVSGRRAVRFEGKAIFPKPNRSESIDHVFLNIDSATENHFIGRRLKLEIRPLNTTRLIEVDAKDQPVPEGMTVICSRE